MIEPASKLSRKLGYQFKDISHLELALTHRSAANQHNERSEYLGDSVLNFVVAEALYHQYPNAKEGELSRYRATLVRKETLAEIARELDLGNYLRLGSGELKSGGHSRDSTLADALEAVLAAVLLDSDFENAKKIILALFKNRIPEVSELQLKDPKSRLQEYLQSRKMALPLYDVVSVKGEAHDQSFTIQCTVKDLNIKVSSYGKSRRKAEQAAAKQILSQLNV
ncbi:MAG: ribonuclease III [Gammaproteobacteria bacterium]|nr:ribonuclease III [Gammaproteobacteria bacterium]